eukprot:CAMPEP_0174344262 /NCGR_PEP_ID=MMETSP0810-20121108/27559_1 /TAXON_ID=73025 ORGANISM="Eutreptiella gymnastica-like, Strain CCMP1594" /NCGR_SAMPLE_ID=MMETSP0810 /ASSEMBLY_ACC=CAM_ASM_000659 /LENGTH=52 /DNA_ID=CAMNT_0015467369 /DNA_START=421 /DNA_END=579 /DNA_ORIENTATION=-
MTRKMTRQTAAQHDTPHLVAKTASSPRKGRLKKWGKKRGTGVDSVQTKGRSR